MEKAKKWVSEHKEDELSPEEEKAFVQEALKALEEGK